MSADVPLPRKHLLSLLLQILLLNLVLFNLCCEGGGGGRLGRSTWRRRRPRGCIDSEREALLRFVKGFQPDPRLSSWTKDGGDCCVWRGVGCDNTTGHVVKLDLRDPEGEKWMYIPDHPNWSRRGGGISYSLLDLKHLAYLDLSGNSLKEMHVPEFLGSLPELIYLNLSSTAIYGTIPPQLGNLTRLQTLDLSLNGDTLSLGYDARWVSKLSSLRYLNLGQVKISSDESSTELLRALNMLPSLSWVSLKDSGLSSLPTFSPHVNFTSLTFLDLSHNFIQSPFPEWVTKVSSLEHLDISFNEYYGTIPAAIRSMPSITVLCLSGNEGLDAASMLRNTSGFCKLQKLEMARMNMSADVDELEGAFSGCILSSLQKLNLMDNQLRGSFPRWVLRMKRLTDLDLSKNHLAGGLPASLSELSTLKTIHLSDNFLAGGIPESLGRLSFLEVLNLSNNSLRGPIPVGSLSNLSSLSFLDLSHNRLGGTVSAAHLSNLRNLEWLAMAMNDPAISFEVDANWDPPFRLRGANLASCKLGPKFPSWLRLQKSVDHLMLANSGISDDIPDSYWSSVARMNILDLSNNQITGRLPDSLKRVDINLVMLKSNRLEGELHPLLAATSHNSLFYLDASNNSIIGAIPEDVGGVKPNLRSLILSSNRLNGSIPTSLCKLKALQVLDLSRNNLSGTIPGCWVSYPSSYGLEFSNLAHNTLSGVSPSSLASLHLNSNLLSGEFLPSLRLNCCASMSIPDLGENEVPGRTSASREESTTALNVLRLRANNVTGVIPPHLGSLSRLLIIDLASNDLVGNIPQEYDSFTATSSDDTGSFWDGFDVFVMEEGQIR